ncbi:hypothetical protein QIA45_05775 (plasmid) [Borreliella andersonii]|uniref:Uncharacterized protein n=1 Tax=Borrelia andersonii TaxID=42109 RepID=A0ACD5G7K0_BORAD
MNRIIKMLIICTVFVLIISCKNFSGSKDLKQGVEEKVKGFLDIKDKITSNGPKVEGVAKKSKKEEKIIVDEIAEKLKEKDEVVKDKEENKKNVNLEEKEDLKNDLKDGKDAKVLKPEIIALENKEPKLEIVEIVKPKLPAMPNAVALVKPLVKEKTEEEKAKDKEAKELRRRRREKYEKEEKERLEREKEREKRKKLRESESSENFLEGITESRISKVTKNIDKIISDIDSINPGTFFEERTEVSGKEVEDKVTGAIYDDITDMRTSGTSIYSEWGDYLEEESRLKGFLDQLEKAREELRSKIKASDNKTNKDTVKISDIKGDLENLKACLRKLKKYLQSTANKEEIQKVVKCFIDPDSDSCE